MVRREDLDLHSRRSASSDLGNVIFMSYHHVEDWIARSLPDEDQDERKRDCSEAIQC